MARKHKSWKQIIRQRLGDYVKEKTVLIGLMPVRAESSNPGSHRIGAVCLCCCALLSGVSALRQSGDVLSD